jgi:hypothetical protein
MAITYHRMQYNQRLKDDLLGGSSGPLVSWRGTAEMETYGDIRFMELRCKSSTDVLEHSILTVGRRNDRVQILHRVSPLNGSKTATSCTLVFGAADFGLHASLTVLSKFMTNRRCQVPDVWHPHGSDTTTLTGAFPRET